jgi:hypothetical protein
LFTTQKSNIVSIKGRKTQQETLRSNRMESAMRACLAMLALIPLLLSSGAQAGSSQSAPTKYSHDPNGKLVRSVVWTRPVGIREFSSSSARRSAPGR